jgi:two-component system, chemotaxis family, sensor kinase CheA
MDINQIRLKFVDEAHELLRNLDDNLMVLEKDPTNNAKFDQIFRVMHTLKGTSGMFGYDKITEITHELENIYDRLREGTLQLSQELVDITFAVGDHVRNLLDDFEFTNTTNVANQQALSQNIIHVLGNLGVPCKKREYMIQKAQEGAVNTYHILFNPDDSLIKRCINLTIAFHDLFTLGCYRINSPVGITESVYWSIFLTTDKSQEDIEDALLFVMDYCKITKIANFNIFDEKTLDSREEALAEAEKRMEMDAKPDPELVPHSNYSRPTQLIHDTGVAGSPSMTQGIRRINVEASKLDNLMYLVSELVTARSELLLSIQDHYSLKTIESAERIDKLSKLFSDNALSIRLVSMEEMLSRFQRLTRDLSKSLGKKVDFLIQGADTELDKNIIDAIVEPIMHLIRNCIDHGLETPEVRRARGKDETGKLTFSAYKSGNYVYVKIEDDGNGVDTDLVYRKGIEKGLIDEGAILNDKEICDLIFQPGFSTASIVTETSGRGVGMDIVWRKIREIRGEISIESKPKKGTAFHIKLQQTISIIDTLLVSSHNTKYAIPIEDVEICGMESHQTIVESQSNLLDFNGELIPYVSLRAHLLSAFDGPDKEKLVIINKQDKRYAIVADQIIGEFQAVVKPLGSTFANQEYLSGASIYGDGSIVLLLDTEKLKNQILTAI